jgi:hypothetical protein
MGTKISLYLLDRIVIQNQILRKYDTRENILIKKSIEDKIKLSADEREVVRIECRPNNQVDVSFVTAEAITNLTEYEFTEAELAYMKASVETIDANGMFSEETLSTYDRIIEAAKDTEPAAVSEPSVND